MFHEALLFLKLNHRSAYLKFLTIIHEIPIFKIAEIGVYKGDHAKILKNLFPQANLYLIDPWKATNKYLKEGFSPSFKKEDFEKAYKKVKNKFKNEKRVHIIRKTSLNAAKTLSNMDLVFIDANHEYSQVKQDINIWKEKINKGGILSGHDYSPSFPGVVKAVNEILGKNIIIGANNIWVFINK